MAHEMALSLLKCQSMDHTISPGQVTYHLALTYEISHTTTVNELATKAYIFMGTYHIPSVNMS